jgi:hypothetical protein
LVRPIEPYEPIPVLAQQIDAGIPLLNFIQIEHQNGRDPIDRFSQSLSIFHDLSRITLGALALGRISFHQTGSAVCSDSYAKSITADVKAESRTKKCEDVIGSGRTSGPKPVKHEMTYSIPIARFNGQRLANPLALEQQWVVVLDDRPC